MRENARSRLANLLDKTCVGQLFEFELRERAAFTLPWRGRVDATKRGGAKRRPGSGGVGWSLALRIHPTPAHISLRSL
jgi:hypothetical protein